VDNGSIYTKNLRDFLLEQNVKYEEYNAGNTENFLTPDQLQKFDSFILTGRRENNRILNAINSKIIKHTISEKKKLLGICYGAEILTLTLGGTIKKSNKQVKGKETVIVEKKNKICQNEINVFESHRYEMSQLGNQLHCLASSKSCKYEVIKHNEHNIFGTQFHPEMSSDGLSIIQAFLSL